MVILSAYVGRFAKYVRVFYNEDRLKVAKGRPGLAKQSEQLLLYSCLEHIVEDDALYTVGPTHSDAVPKYPYGFFYGTTRLYYVYVGLSWEPVLGGEEQYNFSGQAG